MCGCVRAQLCPTLCGASVHRIFQARILEWVAISSSRGSFRSRDWNFIGRQILYHCATWEALMEDGGLAILSCLGGGSQQTGKKGTPEPAGLKGALSNQQHPGLGPFRVAPRTSSSCSEPALVSRLVLPCTLLSKQTRHSGSFLLANTPDLATAPRINKHAARLRTPVLPAVRRAPMGPRPWQATFSLVTDTATVPQDAGTSGALVPGDPAPKLHRGWLWQPQPQPLLRTVWGQPWGWPEYEGTFGMI